MQVQIVEVEEQRERVEPLELSHNVLFLGRGISHDNFVALPICGGQWVSRIHCSIWREGRYWFICDGEVEGKPSKRGLFLNGERISGAIKLKPGQTFVLLSPPPCEILLRIVDDPLPLEDTLTPAISKCYGADVSSQESDDLRAAIASLHADIRQNAALDQQLKDDVALSRVERTRLREGLSDAIATFSQAAENIEQRVQRGEARTKLLTRVVSSLALAVAISLLAISAPDDYQRRGLSLEVALEILLAIGGGGGLAASGRFQKNSGDDNENRLVALDESRFPRAPTGDAGTREFAERGRLSVLDRSQLVRTARADEQGDRDGSGV